MGYYTNGAHGVRYGIQGNMLIPLNNTEGKTQVIHKG